MPKNIEEDFCFLFKGIAILFLVIFLGVSTSNWGVDSLTQQKDGPSLAKCVLLPDGSRQITFLGEKLTTPVPFFLGKISQSRGQVICFFLGKQLAFTPTLQMGQVDVLCKGVEQKISLVKSRFSHFLKKTIKEREKK